MAQMKLIPADNMKDKLWGKRGTPEREAMEAKLKEDVNAYIVGEAIRKARLAQNLTQEQLGEKFETLKNGLIKCGDYIFNFLEDPMVPSDNNASERGIRKLKIKLKNSCTFRSDFGADAFLELHSVVETAKKHNQTPFNAIQALFEV